MVREEQPGSQALAWKQEASKGRVSPQEEEEEIPAS